MSKEYKYYPYQDWIFEYKNDKGYNCRYSIHTDDMSYAWFKALQQCGWEKRITLGLVGNDYSRQIKNGIIMNWFEVNSLGDSGKEPRLKNFMLSLSWNLHDRLSSGFYKVVAI